MTRLSRLSNHRKRAVFLAVTFITPSERQDVLITAATKLAKACLLFVLAYTEVCHSTGGLHDILNNILLFQRICIAALY